MSDFFEEMSALPEIQSNDAFKSKLKNKNNPFANKGKFHNKIQDAEILKTLHSNEKNDIPLSDNSDESNFIVHRRQSSKNEKHQESLPYDLTPVQKVEPEISDSDFLEKMSVPPKVLPKELDVNYYERKKTPYKKESKLQNEIQDAEILEILHSNENKNHGSKVNEEKMLQSYDEISREELVVEEKNILSDDDHTESKSNVPKNQKPENKKQQEADMFDLIPIQKSMNDEPERLDLPSLEKKMLCFLTIILHNNELYYYNDRCYILIRDGRHLVELYRKYISKDIENLKSLKIFDSLYGYMITNPELTPENYEKRLKESKSLVTMSNGILDLENLELYPFDRKYLTFHELNANYVEEKSGTFKLFLNSSSGNDKQIKIRLKEVLGYLFSGNNDAKMFFVMGTAPDSGKSTIVSFMEKVFGDSFIVSIPPHELGQRFALGTISGAIVSHAMDVPDGKIPSQAVSVLKSITGKDRIKTERKFNDPKYHKSNTRFLFGTNYPIKLTKSHNENAFWNRMLIIPFMISISDSEKDPDLIDNLYDERDAIVSQCLQAYSNVFRNGNHFSVCDAADRMKEEWRTDKASYYSVNSFWKEKVKITGSNKDFIPSSSLYQAYTDFCEKQRYELLGYKLMVAWIKKSVNIPLCRSVRRRINGSIGNPVHGFTGIKFRYLEGEMTYEKTKADTAPNN